MKCLSIRQPWAGLIVAGVKKVELRSWRTDHRGRLLVHASTQRDSIAPQWQNVKSQVAASLLLPTGCVIGDVEVVECRPATEWDEDAAFSPVTGRMFAWVLANPRVLHPPVAARGRLRLFDVAIVAEGARLPPSAGSSWLRLDDPGQGPECAAEGPRPSAQ